MSEKQKSRTIWVAYYSLRILLTLELQALFETLVGEFGPEAEIRFKMMSVEQRVAASREEHGIRVVTTRFRIYVDAIDPDSRRTDLEARSSTEP